MAKATVTVAVLLFLFAVAQARFSLDLEKKAVNEEPETVLPESDSKSGATNNFLLLPTEKPETEPEIQTELDTAGIIGFDLEGAEAKLTESETSGGESATTESSTVETTEPEESDSGSDADSNSVTVISFRPMNQHFRRFPSSFRRGHRCHHHHLHQRQDGPMFRMEEGQRVRSRERGYGNDMILSEEGMKFETVRRDGQRMVPGRWMSFRNGDGMRMHHHRFGRHEDMHHERDHEQEYEHEDHEHGHHEHDHHEHDHHEHGHHEHEHHHHQHENIFMRKIRKFLTHF